MCVYAKSVQSCLTLCDPMESPLGSSVHGILQAKILEWVAISSCRGSSHPRDRTQFLTSFARAGGFFATSATWEALMTMLYCAVLSRLVGPTYCLGPRGL